MTTKRRGSALAIAAALTLAAALAGCAGGSNSLPEFTPTPGPIPSGQGGNLSGWSVAQAHYRSGDAGHPAAPEAPPESGVPILYWIEPGRTFAVARLNHACPGAEPASLNGDWEGEVRIGYLSPRLDEQIVCTADLAVVVDEFAVPDVSIDVPLHVTIAFEDFWFSYWIDPAQPALVGRPVEHGETVPPSPAS